MLGYFILGVGAKLLKLDHVQTESKASFIKRVNFFNSAINCGCSVDRAHVLSYAYQNKRQLNVTYPVKIEEDIARISIYHIKGNKRV
jgi:hypothetical protein